MYLNANVQQFISRVRRHGTVLVEDSRLQYARAVFSTLHMCFSKVTLLTRCTNLYVSYHAVSVSTWSLRQY
jgi:hypothetical protein